MKPEQKALRVARSITARDAYPGDVREIAAPIARALRAERNAALEEAAKIMEEMGHPNADRHDYAACARSLKSPAPSKRKAGGK